MEIAAANRLHLVIKNSSLVDIGKWRSVSLDARPALPPQANWARRGRPAGGRTFIADRAPAVHDART
jgi:hypothetical protein